MKQFRIAVGAKSECVDALKACAYKLPAVRRDQVDKWPRITLYSFDGKVCCHILAYFKTTRADCRPNRRQQSLAPGSIRHHPLNHFANNSRRRASPSSMHSRDGAAPRVGN